jgi:hypothetical protein
MRTKTVPKTCYQSVAWVDGIRAANYTYKQ